MQNVDAIPWILPSKVKGQSMIYPGTPRDADAHQVIKEVAADETAKYGRKISPETIIFNMCFHPSTYTRVVSARMRERYKQLKKEKRNEKKSLDGIIRSTRISKEVRDL